MRFVLSVVAAVAAFVRLIAFPSSDVARDADAVVALDGDRPRRLRAAVGLVAAGYAPVLVVVRADNAAPELLEHAAVLPFKLFAFAPVPPTTRGEARAIRALAITHDWKVVVVVTSRFHILRARLIFRRALPGELVVVDAGMDWHRMPLYVASEVAKIVLALTFRRSPQLLLHANEVFLATS